MNNIYLSKSKYCNCMQCEKILWLTRYKPDSAADEDKESVFETGRQVGKLAKRLFGAYEEVPYDENLNVCIKRTDKLLQDKPNVITEATFNWDNNICRVDILKNDMDGVEIYEVKSSTKVKDIYLDDVAYQYFVLSNLGLNIKSASIVYINNKYIRGKELDIKQLFNIEDLTDTVKEKQNEIRNNIEFINNFMEEHGEDNEPHKDLGSYCFNPYTCSFWDYCTRNLPKPNVFDLSGMQTRTKLKKYHEGKISFEDLKNEKINKKALEQIDFKLNDRDPKIEKEAIKDIVDSVKYPLYFIDYEACNFAIPQYEGTKPYQQIPFQYSLNIIQKEGAPVEHKEFLADVDDENMIRNFAESMINDLSEDGSVIVYNRIFEESLVNKKIAEMYPDLKDEIERINGNIVDLWAPFKNRNYYTKEMGDSSSLKDVLPALFPNDPDLDYGNLPLIHKGDEACPTFLRLKDATPEEKEEIREGLLKYCELDTLAMVKIWERFIEVTK